MSGGETQACVLMLGSALCASLQAMDAKYLGLCSMDWTTISLVMNGVTMTFLVVKRIEWTRWLVLRSVLGGISLNAALAAVTHVENLATANTVMFSMPCFATVMACCLDLELPSSRESFRLLTGFVGTLFVVGRVENNNFVGIGCAAIFAIFNAAACVLTARKIENADAAAVCSSQALVAFLGALLLAPRGIFVRDISRLDKSLASLLAAEVLSMPLSLFLRNAALLLTTNVHVVSLLYSEIPMVLAWDRIFCGVVPRPSQIFGVAVIVLGASVAATPSSRKNDAAAERGAAVAAAAPPPVSYDALRTIEY